ncbi:class I SAM-dependent methyltransferase [Clostridium uliginosum]|uniref:Methyltransferase domain-containing protein n=1 Tax=Clostridium uliginosum TaxID=119641 RepID=A0A1I1JMB4_9CLOT|nr:class I SAM-dependent methyltransferase [Clostridium uliginosum]SFC49515.1 Methyltransferase domain-containing protein [Clostridium uliginosum]
MNNNKEYWNSIYSNIQNKKPIYDLWLKKFNDLLEKHKSSTIIDLGCGSGGNSLYLHEKGYKVIACDYSNEALKIVNKHISDIETLNIDITKKLHFEDDSIEIIVADLSLHYFNEATTKEILTEIKRVLKKEGYLICRLNSLDDVNYGSKEGIEIEKHYYSTKAGYKRFFDKKDIKYFFGEWQIKHLELCSLIRYGAEKKAFEVVARK